MISSKSNGDAYATLVSNGKIETISDTKAESGGGDTGFRSHELLEAALASCMNITLRMYADRKGFPLTGIETRVALNRAPDMPPTFAYEIDLEGPLSGAQRDALLDVATRCPVRRTLSGGFAFEPNA